MFRRLLALLPGRRKPVYYRFVVKVDGLPPHTTHHHYRNDDEAIAAAQEHLKYHLRQVAVQRIQLTVCRGPQRIFHAEGSLDYESRNDE